MEFSFREHVLGMYSVPSPNALWHMDSKHKLVRWWLVVYGLIDGFNRMVLYLHVGSNNRADTDCSSVFPTGS